MKGHWIAGTSVNRGPRNGEFEVRCRLEAKFLPVDKRLRIERVLVLANQTERTQNELITGDLPKEELRANGTKPAEDTGELHRHRLVKPDHVYWRRVVAEHHWPACAGTPPKALFTGSDLPALKIHSHVGVEEPWPACFRDW